MKNPGDDQVIVDRRWRRRVVVGLILIALVGVALAGSAALRMSRRERPPPPRQTDVAQIAGWMTVPYIARTFRVPPEEIAGAIGTPLERSERRSLEDLAREAGRPSDDVVAQVRRGVSAYQAAHPAVEKPGKPGSPTRPPGPAPPRP